MITKKTSGFNSGKVLHICIHFFMCVFECQKIPGKKVLGVVGINCQHSCSFKGSQKKCIHRKLAAIPHGDK